MDDTDPIRDWLLLVRSPGFGPVAFGKIVSATGATEASAVLRLPSARLRDLGVPVSVARALRSPDENAVAADIEWLRGAGNRWFIPITDPRYPVRLREIADPPIGLFAEGDLDLLDRPKIAIVGSRNPTSGGRRNAQAFARHLASGGLVVVSGLAEGIDAAAHQGALAGDGMTIAVMGTGPDRVYPAANRTLARRIADTGLLLTEFPTGTDARAGHFPRRNRIIAGTSLGVLVVEAAERSGSLITARQANQFGREVFAIPGSIHNPLSRGCHRLIRQGAKLVETATDIMEELVSQIPSGVAPDIPAESTEPQLDAEYQRLLDAMGFDPVGVDELVAGSGLTAEEVSSMLLILELKGYVTTSPGGRYNRLPDPPA